jgi:DNA-directed RNA polymerase subunit L
MFHAYTESGPPLSTDSSHKSTGHFLLTNTSTTIANTLRRMILTETRSVGFRNSTQEGSGGIQIEKNTSVVFNEMIVHRLSLLPLGVRKLDDFDVARYKCVLRVRNDEKGLISNHTIRHVTARDFRVYEKQENGEFVDVGPEISAIMFPADPITGDTCLLLSLRPQWNPDQPPEEIDLVAFPAIGTGRENMGFSPVSQCSFENTLDPDPVRQEKFFSDWMSEFKKIDRADAVPPGTLENYKKEWETMAKQRCFQVDEKNEPNSFTFTVESVGIRSVSEIVAEGITATLHLLAPYRSVSAASSDILIQPADSRMKGVDITFTGQEHTLGNLLQTVISDSLVGSLESPVTFVGYKVRHPLHREMTLRLGFREETEDMNTRVYEIISAAANTLYDTFAKLAEEWAAQFHEEKVKP